MLTTPPSAVTSLHPPGWLVSEASHQLVILGHEKPFLSTSEVLSMYKVSFAAQWNTALPSGLAPLPHTLLRLQIKSFKIIGISDNEAKSLGLSLSHHIQVDGLNHLPPSLWSCTLCPLFSVLRLLLPLTPGFLQDTHGLPLKLPKSRITPHLHPFVE